MDTCSEVYMMERKELQFQNTDYSRIHLKKLKRKKK